jgi:hypothetical protein
VSRIGARQTCIAKSSVGKIGCCLRADVSKWGGQDVKFLPLVWAGIWRKRGRTILILAQVVTAFTLFGVLQGLNTAIKQAVASTHADRLYTGSRLRFGTPLPISMLARLEATPGVTGVSYGRQIVSVDVP